MGDSQGDSQGRLPSPIGGKFWVLSSDEDAVDEVNSMGEPPPEYGGSSPEPSPSLSSRYAKRIRNRLLQREAALKLSVDLSSDQSGYSLDQLDQIRLTKPSRSPLVKILKVPVLEPTVFLLDDFNAKDWVRVVRKKRIINARGASRADLPGSERRRSPISHRYRRSPLQRRSRSASFQISGPYRTKAGLNSKYHNNFMGQDFCAWTLVQRNQRSRDMHIHCGLPAPIPRVGGCSSIPSRVVATAAHLAMAGRESMARSAGGPLNQPLRQPILSRTTPGRHGGSVGKVDDGLKDGAAVGTGTAGNPEVQPTTNLPVSRFDAGSSSNQGGRMEGWHTDGFRGQGFGNFEEGFFEGNNGYGNGYGAMSRGPVDRFPVEMQYGQIPPPMLDGTPAELESLSSPSIVKNNDAAAGMEDVEHDVKGLHPKAGESMELHLCTSKGQSTFRTENTSSKQVPQGNINRCGTGVFLGGRLSNDEVVDFGGISPPVKGARSSGRIRLQENADDTQMERAQKLAKAKDVASSSCIPRSKGNKPQTLQEKQLLSAKDKGPVSADPVLPAKRTSSSELPLIGADPIGEGRMVNRGSGEEAGAPAQRLVFAYYITGHGFGHATRALEVVRHLIGAGHDVHVVTAAPEFVFTTEIDSPSLHIRRVLLDCGAVQADALTVDRLASLEKYHQTAVVPREAILRTEVEWLTSIKADLVVSDVVPVACRAAADAGIRSVCVTNFSWDFIYAEYVVAAGHHHRSIVWQIAEDYSHCEFLLRLPGYCPMPAFRDVIDVPLVVRRLHKSRSEVRKELGIADDVKVVIFNFGGQPAGWKLKKEWLPDGWLCLVCGASDTQELPPNYIKLAKDAYTPDLMAASDCMLGKIGYGTVSEALAYKLPFVFVRRDYFNEEPFLRNMLEHYQCGIEMIRRDLLTGHWKPYLLRALTLKPCYDGQINGGEVAANILQDTAVGKKYIIGKLSGARRLRDAIVLGYQLQRAPGRDVGIPDWYSLSEKEIGVRPAVAPASHGINGNAESSFEDFEILHGDMQGLTDTMDFLTSLSGLVGNDPRSPEKQSRERTAASVLFDLEEEIYVARAPGRLDVMGGIADYSGSLVLQMPIREACHVAIQRTNPIKQKLWKHAQARQLANGAVSVVQIVSFGSELSNRAPTFDMDLSDFMDGDKPISYDKAKEYFSQDPSQKWAAYVAGTILVLMTELGVRFTDSLSILVSSSVPEGKGVSSSASVEVATMSAIAAVYGLNIAPRDLAILCQKVENHIVGAPCGVMDQMTSACGEANKLLAMVCQPAEVKELVSIPTHIRFWGLDSGIRHSVGGTDYGSVRVGTYMGRKMLKCAASNLLSQSFPSTTTQSCDTSEEYEKYGVELLKSEASLQYLCNLPPHRYEASYARDIPEVITGDEFLEKYGDHNDAVTVVDPKRSYSVKAPTRHPIYENFRVEAFKALLTAAKTDEQLSALGELMYQCHYSYNACGLGSDGTDRLVNLVQEIQHRKTTSQNGGPSLFGAKITGGGSGGSVCVIGKNCLKSSEEIFEIQKRYKAATGYLPIVFEGSSPGAGKFGYLKIRWRST
ncbi:hypothetical protein ACQ4PT_061373 [Festuca glaucescens]